MAESNTPTIKKTGVQVGTSKYIDFYEGDNVTIDIDFDDLGKKSDITISAAAGGSSAHTPAAYSAAPPRHTSSLLSATILAALDELDAEVRDAVFAYHEGVRPTESASDNATRLNAILAAADGNDAQLVVLPYGQVDFDDTLLYGSGQHVVGYGVHDFTSLLNFTGADGDNAIQPIVDDQSRLYLKGFRLKDGRTSPTSGMGLVATRVKNLVRMDMIAVTDFPQTQVYVGKNPLTGSTAEVVHLSNIFADGGTYPIYLEDIDNNCLLEHIWPGDGITGARGENIVSGIYIGHQTAGAGVFSIRSVKMESNNGANVLEFGSTFHGSAFVESMTMRGPTAALGGDVVRINSEDGVYIVTNIASAALAGSVPVATNLVHDTATGATYDTDGKKLLAFRIIDKGSVLSVPTATSGIDGPFSFEGPLQIPAGSASGTANARTVEYDAVTKMLQVHDGTQWTAVELG